MIPYALNPLGIAGGNPLIDQYTKFLLFGAAGVKDIAKGTAVENHGLVVNGEYITGSTSSSYAVIPANALSEDVLCNTHDWTFEMVFVPPNTIVSGRLFGLDWITPTYRLDLFVRQTTGQLGIGGMVNYILPTPT